MSEQENGDRQTPAREGEKDSWKAGFEFKAKPEQERAAPGGQLPDEEHPGRPVLGEGERLPAEQPPDDRAAGEPAPERQPLPGPADVTELISTSELGGGEGPVPSAETGEAQESDTGCGGVTELMVRTPSAKDLSSEPTIIQAPPLGVAQAEPAARAEAALPETISDTKLAEIATESGMARSEAVKRCLDLVASGEGGPKNLAEALMSEGVLTEQQVHTLEQVAREGGTVHLLGDYQLLEKLGEGGMGAVYKARQIALDRLVALKILPERLSDNAEFVGRFEREARAAAKLDHPNVVRAIDAGKASGKYFFAMEFIEGASIEDTLERTGVVPEEKAIGMMIQVAQGLECAWKHGLIHRDIKPDNILITSEGVAKILDLGLAREVDTADATRLTQDGAAMGTPHYISPEQARGEEVDIRTDIYALGVTLYRMVTGEFPFSGKDPVSIIMARFHETPKAANEVNDEVSDELAQVIATMMAGDRELRYPDPAVLLHDLELLAKGEEPEYASSSKELREKAVEAARSRRSVATTTGIIVVRRRRRRERAFIVAGAVIAAAVVVSALLLGLGRGKPQDRPAALEAASDLSQEAAAAREALEEEAAAFYEKLKALFDAEKYAEVTSKADEAGTKFAATPSGPKIDGLRRQAADRLAEIERRLAAEAENEKRYRDLVTQARENLALEDHAMATSLLTQAKAIRDTEEVQRLFKEARRLQYLARAEDAELAGKLEEAIDFYKRALALGDDAELRGRVAELERRVALAGRIAEGDTFVGRGAWKSARTSYRDALAIAKDRERPPVEEKLALVETEIDYLALIIDARADAVSSRWRDVLGGARKAGAIKPEEAEPKELVLRARKALGPEKRLTNSLGMEFVLVPAGEFTMGSDSGDADEKPVRKIRLDAYYICAHELTNAQFEEYDPSHGRLEYSTGDETPVVAVSWRDAAGFCKWLSKKEGVDYRLPTEAEWEMAARGTDGRTFPWGEGPASSVLTEGGRWRCNIGCGVGMESWDEDGHSYAAPVGSYPEGVSPFGCMDMAGNVWEWCLDWYRGDSYRTGGTSNPRGPPAGKQHVMRGGSFAEAPRTARCSNRTAHEPAFVEANVGFRVVRALDPIFIAGDSGREDGARP